MNQVVPTPKAKSEFLELARVILDRLKEPRIQGWWQDLFGLTSDLEDCRRELSLPHWLPEWNAEYDARQNAKHYDAALDLRPLLDPRWKPGNDCHPDCFNFWMQGQNGTAESVKFAFCDPYRSMDAWGDSYDGRCDSFAVCAEFCVVTVSLQVAEAEIAEGKPVFDAIRRDAIFILKQWIRYVEAMPIPLIRDRRTGELLGGDVQCEFASDGITPEEIKVALERMDGSLFVPKSIADTEFILWHKGQRPHHQPTRGEQYLSALLHAKESQQQPKVIAGLLAELKSAVAEIKTTTPDDPRNGSPRVDRLVTADQIALFLGIKRTSLATKSWPTPAVNGRGNIPAQFRWDELRPALVTQYPKDDWSSF